MFSKIAVKNILSLWGRSLQFALLFLLFQNFLIAQDASNPFEIISGLDPSVQKQIEEKRATGAPNNPFDIVKGNSIRHNPQFKKTEPKPVQPPQIESKENEPAVILSAPERGFRQFLFITILIMMIVFTLVFTLFRNYIGKAWSAFTNDTMMSQVYREKTISISFPYHILYMLFLCNAGLFLLLVTKNYGITISETHLQSLLLCIGGVILIFVIQHFLLKFMGLIFPVSKDTGRYSFTIQIFNIVIGIALIPMILIIAYAPQNLVNFLLPAFLILIGLAYLFRYLRGLMIANRYLAYHKFHFLLYICAAEIAPFLILIKLLNKGTF